MKHLLLSISFLILANTAFASGCLVYLNKKNINVTSRDKSAINQKLLKKIAKRLEKKGYELVESEEQADFIYRADAHLDDLDIIFFSQSYGIAYLKKTDTNEMLRGQYFKDALTIYPDPDERGFILRATKALPDCE